MRICVENSRLNSGEIHTDPRRDSSNTQKGNQWQRCPGQYFSFTNRGYCLVWSYTYICVYIFPEMEKANNSQEKSKAPSSSEPPQNSARQTSQWVKPKNITRNSLKYFLEEWAIRQRYRITGRTKKLSGEQLRRERGQLRKKEGRRKRGSGSRKRKGEERKKLGWVKESLRSNQMDWDISEFMKKLGKIQLQQLRMLYSNSRNGATPSFFSINVQQLSHRFAFQRSPAVPAVKTPMGVVAKNT